MGGREVVGSFIHAFGVGVTSSVPIHPLISRRDYCSTEDKKLGNEESNHTLTHMLISYSVRDTYTLSASTGASYNYVLYAMRQVG